MNAREQRTNYPTLTVSEFRDRVRILCGVPEGAGKKSHPCLVKRPGDRGYFKTQTKPTETKEQ